MDRKFYIITYKETTVDECDVLNVESGSFDYGYETMDEAKNALKDIGMMGVCGFEDDDDVEEHWSDNGEALTISFKADTYEYIAREITIPDRDFPF